MGHATTNRSVNRAARGAACMLAICAAVGMADAAFVLDRSGSGMRIDRRDEWSVEVDEAGALLDRNWAQPRGGTTPSEE